MRLLNRKKHPAPSGGKRPPFRNVSSEPLYKRNPVPTRGRSGHVYRDEARTKLMKRWFGVLAIAMCVPDLYLLDNYFIFIWPLLILLYYINGVLYNKSPVDYKEAIIGLIFFFAVTHVLALLYCVVRKFF
jgi:hypothetical protein